MTSLLRPGRAWCALAAVLALGALLARHAEPHAIDWQPALAGREPWRAWTAAFLHYSALHLVANGAGLALVAALGVAARAPARQAAAWAAAWPLTQLLLLVQPALLHYGGLSGVLHAGVAVVALHLVGRGDGRAARLVGAVLAAGLAFKVVGETPWGPPLRHPPGWDIAVAPVAHATGLVAGLLCALGAEVLHGWLTRRGRPLSAPSDQARSP